VVIQATLAGYGCGGDHSFPRAQRQLLYSSPSRSGALSRLLDVAMNTQVWPGESLRTAINETDLHGTWSFAGSSGPHRRRLGEERPAAGAGQHVILAALIVVWGSASSSAPAPRRAPQV